METNQDNNDYLELPEMEDLTDGFDTENTEVPEKTPEVEETTNQTETTKEQNPENTAEKIKIETEETPNTSNQKKSIPKGIIFLIGVILLTVIAVALKATILKPAEVELAPMQSNSLSQLPPADNMLNPPMEDNMLKPPMHPNIDMMPKDTKEMLPASNIKAGFDLIPEKQKQASKINGINELNSRQQNTIDQLEAKIVKLETNMDSILDGLDKIAVFVIEDRKARKKMEEEIKMIKTLTKSSGFGK